MKPAALAILSLLAVPAMTGRAAAQATAVSLTANQLAAKVIAAKQERGFRIRATMTRTTPGTDIRDVRQLSIKGSRELNRSIVLYQQVWPDVPDGLALVIEDSGSHRLKGFQYEAGRVTPLSDDMLGRRFFDSDLTLEDLAESFWYWPTLSLGGQEDIGPYPTVVVSMRPGPSIPSTYSLVRKWVAPELALGLRTELYGRTGSLAKTISLYRMLKFGTRWVPGIMTVEPTERRSRTVIEGVEGQRDIPVSRSEFTPAAVQRELVSTHGVRQ